MNRGQPGIVEIPTDFLMQAEINWEQTLVKTEPAFHHVPAEYPHYLVVDIYDVFMDFQNNPGLQTLFSRFPLHRIIETALSQTAYNHDDQAFWVQFEDYFGSQMDFFDLDLIALFYESLAFHVDEVVRTRFQRGQFDTGNYIFSKWVGPTSLELRFDENNSYIGDDRSGSGLQLRTIPSFGDLPGSWP